MYFSRQFWRKKYQSSKRKGVKSPFGGRIKSDEEIQELNRKIEAHEDIESQKADLELEMRFQQLENDSKEL